MIIQKKRIVLSLGLLTLLSSGIHGADRMQEGAAIAEEVTCPVCTNDISEKGYPFDCGNNHLFHKDCLPEWLYEKIDGEYSFFKQNVRCPMCRKRSLLEAAYNERNPSVIINLVQTGSDVNALSHDDATVLHCLCANPHLNDEQKHTVVAKIVERCDATKVLPLVNAVTSGYTRSTALIAAVKKSLPMTVRSLIAAKADPLIRDRYNKNTIYYADHLRERNPESAMTILALFEKQQRPS